MGLRPKSTAAVWYSFQPAEENPSDKPLVILFNGITGPALGVLAFNTGHFTFDPTFTNGADFADNPHRWTDFANLLYIDEPGAGWSYHLPRADGSTPPFEFDAYAHAADHLRVVFRFLETHPQIANVPVVIAGESGGGLKGVNMAKIMLDYPTLVAGGPYQDAGLHAEILEFLGARRTDIDPSAWTPADRDGVHAPDLHQPVPQPLPVGGLRRRPDHDHGLCRSARSPRLQRDRRRVGGRR